MKLGISKRSSFRDFDMTNAAGGGAFSINDASQRLLHIVGASNFNEPSSYYPTPDGLSHKLVRQFAINGSLNSLTGPAKDIINTALEVCSTGNLRDVLAIAHWLRKDGNVRQTPIVLFACAAYSAKTDAERQLIREYGPRIIRRADELVSAYAAYRYLFGKPIPRSFLNGIKAAFKNFDEYQLIKYSGERKNPSLRDVLLQMPDRSAGNPVSRGMAEFILNGTLIDKNGVDHSDTAPLAANYLYFLERAKEVKSFTPEMVELADRARATWEVVISLFGSNKQTWESVLPRMGYMAVLRNLRNMVSNDVDAKLLADLISDRNAVLKSKQFPFRFLAASKEIAEANFSTQKKNLLLDGLSQALEFSVENIGSVPGDTIVLVDVSGSMDAARVSRHSTMSVKEVAACMAAIFAKACQNAYIYVFASDTELLNVRKVDSAHSIMNAILNANVGGATYAYKPIYDAIGKGIKADRIVLLSDMQCYSDNTHFYSAYQRRMAGERSVASGVTAYRDKLNKDVWLHSVNLNAHDASAQIPSGQRVNLVSGFSDKILSTLMEAEGGNGIPTLDFIRSNF